MRTIIALLGLFILSGCLTSTRPLISKGDFPLPEGTLLAQYQTKNGKLVPVGDSKLGTLSIERGWYVHSVPGKQGSDAFRLHRVDDSNWVMMLHLGDQSGMPERAYAWLRRDGEMFVVYPFQAKNFREWANRVGFTQSGWRAVGENIHVSSLDLLIKVMPAMIAEGHHMSLSTYRAIPETPELRANRKAREKLKQEIGKIDQELAQLDEQRKKLCGGRVCSKSKSGKEVYRTETYDPPRWYYADGRLAPQSDWPR